MKKHIILILGLVSFLYGCTTPIKQAPKELPAIVLGVYAPGHNTTEPRPQRSKYLETIAGGVVIFPQGAGMFLNTKVIKRPTEELYVTVEYENPNTSSPLVNDMMFMPDAKELHFSVPRFQTGLRSYVEYTITVRIWEKSNRDIPIDTLVQKIRSYVDTTGATPLVFDRIEQK